MLTDLEGADLGLGFGSPDYPSCLLVSIYSAGRKFNNALSRCFRD